jgi:tetratricopeptide (TPR) repeat protein
MLSSADPWAEGESDVTVVEALKGATENLDDEFEGQPLLEARIRALVGSLDMNVGNMPAAKEQTVKSLALMRQELGPDALELADIWGGLSQIERVDGDFDEAIHAAKEKSRIVHLHFPSPSPDVVKAWDQLALAYVFAQQREAADSVLTLQENMIRELGDEHRVLLAQVMLNRGNLVSGTDFAAQDSLSTAALKIYRQYDPDNPNIGIAMNNVGTSLLARGKFEEAKASFEETMAFFEKTLGPDHPEYASACENLANVEYRMKHYDESLKLLDRVLDIRRRNLGPDHVNVIRSELNVATVAEGTGDYERALKVYDELLPRLRENRGGDHPDVATVLRNRSNTLRKMGRYDEAEASLGEARAMYERLYGKDASQVGLCHSMMAHVFLDEKRFDAAEKELRIGLPILREKLGDEHVYTKGAAERMVQALEATGRGDEAAEYRKLAGEK